MNFDTLVGSYVRQYNRYKLRFSEDDAGMTLPDPDASRNYLLYLHIPYCVVLCPFCSFHRVRFDADGAGRYFDHLRNEVQRVTERGYRFDEVYIGGGTPTVLPEQLVKTISALREQQAICEISVETNPDDLKKDKMSGLRGAGVNRLSVGVQSFDDTLLRQMERLEKYGKGAEIISRLREVEGLFDTLNVDMIFNFPHQDEKSLNRDLAILTDEIGVDQVSFYPLMTVNTTRRKMLQTVGRVDYSRERTFYEIIAGHMLSRDYLRSSAWCFSRRPGMFDEYIIERDEYVGLGSGAFSYLQGSLFASTFSINHYCHLVETGKTGTIGRLDMSERDQMRYYMLMQLFGGALDKESAERRFNGRFKELLWPELMMLRAIGAIRDAGTRFSLTENGYYLWVMLMREFFTGVNNLRDQMRHNISREAYMMKSQ